MIKINQNLYLQKRFSNKKKKRPDTKSIYELIKKNYNISISESEMENFIDEMINKKLIYNKKTDQGLDSL